MPTGPAAYALALIDRVPAIYPIWLAADADVNCPTRPTTARSTSPRPTWVMIAAILRNQAIDGTVVCAGRLVDDATSHPISAGWARCLARHRVVRPTDAANHSVGNWAGPAGRTNHRLDRRPARSSSRQCLVRNARGTQDRV